MLKLEAQQRNQLLALTVHPGYAELLDLMEKMCQIAETEFLKKDRAHGATDTEVLSAHDQCRAQRVFFERVQMEIKAQEIEAIRQRKELEAEQLHRPANDDGKLVWDGENPGRPQTDEEILGFVSGERFPALKNDAV